jgi:hypothetical protein
MPDFRDPFGDLPRRNHWSRPKKKPQSNDNKGKSDDNTKGKDQPHPDEHHDDHHDYTVGDYAKHAAEVGGGVVGVMVAEKLKDAARPYVNDAVERIGTRARPYVNNVYNRLFPQNEALPTDGIGAQRGSLNDPLTDMGSAPEGYRPLPGGPEEAQGYRPLPGGPEDGALGEELGGETFFDALENILPEVVETAAAV